ncbi:MAG: nucleoside deaminase [Phycisphaerales bacterium]|nr:nucleoside deaminase [Phycisphaerales bacterium]
MAEPTPTDLLMMRRALELADEASELGEVPVGAVVYETMTGVVLGEGRNTREGGRDPTGHAEFTAIKHACDTINDWRLNHCTLVVTLEPCPMCAGLIVNARVGRVVFGASDPKAGAVRSLYGLLEDTRLNHRAEVIEGVLADESSDRLKGFFRSLREPR